MLEKKSLCRSIPYNRFYDLYEEISHNDFFNNTGSYRFYKIREIFSVYKELLGYEPIKFYIEVIKRTRPPLEGIIVSDLFSFIRNLLLHFPIFNNWNDVYISKNLATWNKAGTIHRFLEKSSKIKIDDKGTIHYRIWEKSKKLITDISISFPEEYGDNNSIFLIDLVSEQEGIKLCLSFMKQILDSQIVSDEEQDIQIMSQVYIPKG